MTNNRFTHLASLGFRIFPCLPQSKKPAVRWSEFQEREPTPEELTAWDASNYNVAIITGEPSNLWVLDPDDEEAQAFVDSLGLPETVVVKTGKGGHLYFRPPPGGASNQTGMAGKHLDSRSDGGYVIAPPSIHENGSKYEWIRSPDEVPIAPFPEQLLPLLKRAATKSARPTNAAGIYVPEKPGVERFMALELRRQCRELSKAEEGARNDGFYKAAVAMANHVPAAEADWSTVAAILTSTGAQIGLGEAEMASTLESAWKRGSLAPTEWIHIARRYVYLGAQDRFYSKSNGTYLRIPAMDHMYAKAHRGEGKFSSFLLGFGFVEKVSDITYDPRQPTGTVFREGDYFYNTYVPADIAARAGDAAPFVKFVEHLIPDRDVRQHFLRVIAFTVRNPGQKVRHALMLRTATQGVGKSLLATTWAKLMGERNMRKVSSNELASNFDGWQKQCTLIVCEELNLRSGKGVYNSLKEKITGDTMWINEKHLQERCWELFATFFFLTNLEKPLLIEPSDRRICFYDSPADKLSEHYYPQFAAWIDNNLGVIRWYLDQIDISSFDPYAPPPMTEAKKRLIDGSRNPLSQDIDFHIQERTRFFAKDIVTLDEVAISAGLNPRPTDRALSRALVDLGAVKLGQQSIDGRRHSLWAIRRAEIWQSWGPADRAEEFKRKEGLFFELDELGIPILPTSRWPGDKRYMLLSARGPRTLDEAGDHLQWSAC